MGRSARAGKRRRDYRLLRDLCRATRCAASDDAIRVRYHPLMTTPSRGLADRVGAGAARGQARAARAHPARARRAARRGPASSRRRDRRGNRCARRFPRRRHRPALARVSQRMGHAAAARRGARRGQARRRAPRRRREPDARSCRSADLERDLAPGFRGIPGAACRIAHRLRSRRSTGCWCPASLSTARLPPRLRRRLLRPAAAAAARRRAPRRRRVRSAGRRPRPHRAARPHRRRDRDRAAHAWNRDRAGTRVAAGRSMPRRRVPTAPIRGVSCASAARRLPRSLLRCVVAWPCHRFPGGPRRTRRSPGSTRTHPTIDRSKAADAATHREEFPMDMMTDVDPQETREWLDALDGVIDHEGPDRAHFLIEQLIDKARRRGAYVPFSANTAYINTIPTDRKATHAGRPGDRGTDPLLRALERDGDGRAREQGHQRRRPHRQLRLGGDAVRRRLQPLLARAVRRRTAATCSTSRATRRRASMRAPSCSGRLTEEQLDNFRQEVDGKGISSYPHPWLMPDFWQFPTVSMGLGPLMAIYQARFLKYLQARGIAQTEGRKVWAFCGDGEMDEPESLGAIGMAGAREARQPDLRHQLQPAAPRRPGARQRQDHPGARKRVPRRGLERHQGDLGHALGRAARARQGGHPDASG